MSDTYTPRRGRPSNAEIAARNNLAAAEVNDSQSSVSDEAGEDEYKSPARRRKRAGVGGFKQRLDAPQRQGYVRRWVNDDGVRPELLHTDLAYDFVLDANTRTDGQGKRVSRIVGKKASGEPLYAYLMETPVEEFRVGEAEKEDRLKPFEEAIRSGRDAGGEFRETDQIYRPGAGSSLKRS